MLENYLSYFQLTPSWKNEIVYSRLFIQSKTEKPIYSISVDSISESQRHIFQCQSLHIFHIICSGVVVLNQNVVKCIVQYWNCLQKMPHVWSKKDIQCFYAFLWVKHGTERQETVYVFLKTV